MKNEVKDYNNAEKFNSVKILHNANFAKLLAKWSLMLLGLLTLFMFFPWTQNIRSNGVLTTLSLQERPQTIHSVIAGQIAHWHVNEGAEVKKGDTIVTISEIREKFFDPELLTRLDEQINAKEGSREATASKAQALRRQIQALKEGMDFSLNKAKNRVQQAELLVQTDSIDLEAVKIDYEIAQLQFERQEKLYKQGLKSLTEFEQRKLRFQESTAKLNAARNKFDVAKNNLMNANIELSSILAEYQDKIAKAESDLNSTEAYFHEAGGEIAKMRNEYSNMKIRSSFYHIVAPQDGYVVRGLRAGLGETVKEGDPVTTIMPSNAKLATELYVRPLDITLLKPGSKVRLQFDGWPALVFSGWPNVSFGTFGGKVAVIDNIDTNGKYRILVTPDPDEDPWPRQLRVGSGAYGWALLNDVPIWYELWRQLNGFPPDWTEGLEHFHEKKNNKYK
ncbi:HlyD family efflux transporter periplasmic adaptor subunit [Cytophagaceae bacterium ABcell3]|nr:HlyD family efflux transporter periplasmic adaptor subunit [Cytophagaceae bacterium ABcell3]